MGGLSTFVREEDSLSFSVAGLFAHTSIVGSVGSTLLPTLLAQRYLALGSYLIRTSNLKLKRIESLMPIVMRELGVMVWALVM